ncbi:MAG: HD domain-containing protein [Deltaproteobacteria bacterium]|nr:HD domain-containing protein [Deltaproteobacteria bacterium]
MIKDTCIFSLLRKNPLLEKIYLISREISSPLYIVGGSIRDLFVKGHFADLDFAVHEKVEAVACAVAESLGGTSFSLGSEKKSCWRVALSDDDELLEMDFTAFKGDNIEADLAKRDFTINAIALSLSDLFEASSPGLIDPFDGRGDLEKGILRPLSEEALKEDPLRIIRGFRLMALFDLQRSEDFLILAVRYCSALKKVAHERIRAELFKTFSAARASSTLQLMVETGVLQVILPEIIEWEKLDQGSFHKFDLLMHSLKTFACLEEILLDESLFSPVQREMIAIHLDEKIVQGIDRRGLLKFAAFLHDSGKPLTFKREAAKVSFHGHEEEGAILNKGIARRLKLGSHAGKVLSNITKRHMRPLHLSKAGMLTGRAMDRMIRDCGDELIEVLLLALADTLATRDARKVEFTDVEGLVQKLIDRCDEVSKLSPAPLLKGNDVMRIRGIGEGALVGKYLGLIEDARIDGEIENRDEAIRFLKKLKAPGPPDN